MRSAVKTRRKRKRRGRRDDTIRDETTEYDACARPTNQTTFFNDPCHQNLPLSNMTPCSWSSCTMHCMYALCCARERRLVREGESNGPSEDDGRSVVSYVSPALLYAKSFNSEHTLCLFTFHIMLACTICDNSSSSLSGVEPDDASEVTPEVSLLRLRRAPGGLTGQARLDNLRRSCT